MWRTRQTLAIQQLKEALIGTIGLRSFDRDKPLKVSTDAGAVWGGVWTGRKREPEKLLLAYERKPRAVVHALAGRRQFVNSKTWRRITPL